jgi:hypothetical protein
MGEKWNRYKEILDSPKIFLPTLLIFWIVILFLLCLTWMDDRKFGILGTGIAGGIIAPITWFYNRLKKKSNISS